MELVISLVWVITTRTDLKREVKLMLLLARPEKLYQVKAVLA